MWGKNYPLGGFERHCAKSLSCHFWLPASGVVLCLASPSEPNGEATEATLLAGGRVILCPGDTQAEAPGLSLGFRVKGP